MFCPDCGLRQPDQHRYCFSCGAPLALNRFAMLLPALPCRRYSSSPELWGSCDLIRVAGLEQVMTRDLVPGACSWACY
jgi:hypothetical protein